MLDVTRLRDICKEVLDAVLFSMQIAATGFVGLSFAATMLRTHDDPNTVRLVPAPTSTTTISPEAETPPAADSPCPRP